VRRPALRTLFTSGYSDPVSLESQIPSIVSGVESFKALATPRHRFVREIGIDDLKFSLTSNLTADATLNPDFAQTEADTQQINLTRFSLFFPEKRQFFIEGSDSFPYDCGRAALRSSPARSVLLS
jgi:hypothetical protein